MSIHRISTNRTKSIANLMNVVRLWRVWIALAVQDIVIRYRGSVIGPFWITISTAVMVFSMGYLYGALFGIDRGAYLPYFSCGLIIWNFISLLVNESTKILPECKHYMENTQLPCMVYIFRLICRNLMVFAHSLPVYILVAALYKIHIGLNVLMFIPGILLLCLNGVFFGAIIAFISSRFPDIGAIVLNVLQVFFFITPIMWMPSSLPVKYHIFLYLNPFYYYVNLIKHPMLGLPIGMDVLLGAISLTFIGFLIYLSVFRTYEKRVIFWL